MMRSEQRQRARARVYPHGRQANLRAQDWLLDGAKRTSSESTPYFCYSFILLVCLSRMHSSRTSTGKVRPGTVIAGQPWKYLVKRSACRRHRPERAKNARQESTDKRKSLDGKKYRASAGRRYISAFHTRYSSLTTPRQTSKTLVRRRATFPKFQVCA